MFHIEPIIDLNAYFKKSKPCIQCLSFRANSRAHFCKIKKRKMCMFCRKLLLEKTDYYNESLQYLFCARNIITDTFKVCQYCAKTFHNQKCLSLHKTNCKKVKICEVCSQKYDTKSHECYTKTCFLCREKYNTNTDESHYCNVKIPTLPRIYSRLIIFDMETRFQSTKTGYQLEPNLIIALFERGYHESFSSIAFFDKEMTHSKNENIIEDSLQISYLPKDYNLKVCTVKLSSFYKGRSFEKQGPVINISNENNYLFEYYIPFSERLENNCVYRFLRFFIRPYFRHSVLISHGGSRFDNIPIISILLKFPSIKTDIVHIGGAAIYIKIEDLNIVFIDFLRYCHGSLANLCKQFDLNVQKSFFPYK